jgi:hypothetical protein
MHKSVNAQKKMRARLHGRKRAYKMHSVQGFLEIVGYHDCKSAWAQANEEQAV